MAKLYGSLVGAAVQALLVSGSGPVSNDYKDSVDQVLWRDYVVTKGNVIGDTISLGFYPSKAWIDTIRSYCVWDAFGAGVTYTFGDINFPTGVRGNNSLAAANKVGFFNPVGAANQPLWQRLGYGADPLTEIELLATLGGANPPDGKAFAWQFFGHKH